MSETNTPKNVAMQASGIPAQVAEFGRSRRKSLTIEAVLYTDTGECRLTFGEEHTYTREEMTDFANAVVQHALDHNGSKIIRDAQGSSLNVLTNLMTTPLSGNLRGVQTYVLMNQSVASGWVLGKARRAATYQVRAAKVQVMEDAGEAYYALNVPSRAFPSERKAANASLRASNPNHTGTINELTNFKTLQTQAKENMVVQGQTALQEAVNGLSAKMAVTFAQEAGAPTSVKTKAAAVKHLLA